MTDGAAKLIEVIMQEDKKKGNVDPILKNAFDHLTTRDPATFITSGQWVQRRKNVNQTSKRLQCNLFDVWLTFLHR